MKKNKIHLSLFAVAWLIILSASAKAQNFSYSLQKDSSAYNDLIGSTVLVSGESFINKSYTVHFPFHYNFCGTIADSVRIETNGFLIFDQAKQLALMAYNNFGSQKDSLQNYVASISYVISGTSGNRVVKIQFKNLAQNSFSSFDLVSYQVWIYESGNKIEVRTGENASTEVPVLIGIINRNMDTEDKAYLLNGNPSNPAGQIISGTTDLISLDRIPYGGTIYTLTPTF